MTVTVLLRYFPAFVMDNKFGILIATNTSRCINCWLLGIEVLYRPISTSDLNIPAASRIGNYMMSFLHDYILTV